MDMVTLDLNIVLIAEDLDATGHVHVAGGVELATACNTISAARLFPPQAVILQEYVSKLPRKAFDSTASRNRG